MLHRAAGGIRVPGDEQKKTGLDVNRNPSLQCHFGSAAFALPHILDPCREPCVDDVGLGVDRGDASEIRSDQSRWY